MHARHARPTPGSRIRGLIGWLLLAVLVLAAVGTAVATTVGGYHVTKVLTNSMRPTFTAGDHLVVRDRPVDDIAVGDVVVLPNPNDGSLYIHRLTTVERVDGDTIVTTKGDNNPSVDAWTLEVTSETLPVYRFAIPTHALHLPVAPIGTSQLLLALGLAAMAVVIALPSSKRPVEATDAEEDRVAEPERSLV